MSHSSSPNNRNSIFGWMKNLKRGSLMSNESVNEITSDNDLLISDSKSPSKSLLSSNSNNQLQPIPFPQQHQNEHQQQQSNIFSSNSPHQEFLRPLLHHKSRSTNNVNRVRSNSLNQSEKSSSIRQHRDSFLQHNPLVDENSKYFGVSLEDAINQAAAKISILTNEDSSNDQVLQYGKIPIVVAKCGVYLKKNGLSIEGIFRVGGSSKRLKDLQLIFNTPPDFGKKLNWDGYTVHDAASILRRYLNALPEPLIPLELYEEFRDPLRKRPRIINYMKYKAEYPNKSLKSQKQPTDPSETEPKLPSSVKSNTPINNSNSNLLDSEPLTEANIGRLNSTNSSVNDLKINHSNSDLSNLKSDNEADIEQDDLNNNDDAKHEIKKKKSKNYKKLTRNVHEAINEYKSMVDELPMLSKQLLFYILDLLAMVQNHSSENLMSSRNLAAIFQPSILSHPNHDMDPVEYALSQSVVEFLIQYAYKLLPNQNSDDDIANNNNRDNSNINDKKSKSSSPNTENDDQSNDLKPPQPVFKRKHSKSLSSTNNNDDLIGYQSSPSKKLVDTSDNEFDITDVTDNEDSNVDDTTNSDLDDVNFHSLNIDHNNNNNNNNYPQTDIDSGSEFNFGHDHDHEDNFNFNHDNPGILNKLINQEEKNDAESDPLSNPPNSNVAIIVSTPSCSSVPKMK